MFADEEVERHLRHEKARSSAVRVVDGRSDVLVCEPLERVDGGQAVRKYLVEDITTVPKSMQGRSSAGSSCKQSRHLYAAESLPPEQAKDAVEIAASRTPARKH